MAIVNCEVRWKKDMEKRSGIFEGVPVLIKNIDPEVDDRLLIEKFSTFGQILKMKTSPDVHKMRTATLFYMSPADAQRAISNMNGARLLSKVICAKLDNPFIRHEKKSHATYRNLFIKS
ncbi:polyadenylate-binding protein 5 isoform X1 [Hydra vulgaris]|uniref:polyadenylate-binding protein 5 isoform X1 n=1 Tax=Hydra vulgaris TaxID=6087 RepID=UPI0006412CCD|nr:polyadenylate-binding protein 5-like [Hydra vulgaris]